ncbi:MAG: SDR family NAD(P)-dependent oxidoreductase [Clostridia bacterium]|nr:SDR family NAD(P)-dependent oxidoreductase [Clostridia bacterium]
MCKKWLFGKNIVITGASSGIGFEVSKLLAGKYFCHIIGTGRNEEKLEKAKQEIQKSADEVYEKSKEKHRKKYERGSFDFYAFDVSDKEAWQQFKKHLEDINFMPDIVINNAGMFLEFEKAETQDIEKIENVLKTNFLSQVYSYKTFEGVLKERKGGLINISSSAALCPVVGAAAYSASKAASKNFTESIMQEHKKEFYVGGIYPGFTKTNLFHEHKQISKLVLSVCQPVEKVAKKIVKAISRKRKRTVIGFDAHLMSGFCRMFPILTPSLIRNVLSSSHDQMFDKVFVENSKKRKNKKNKKQ